MYSGGIHPSEKGKTMKRTIGMLCLTLALLLALAACRPANSIFNELILDGIHTHYKNLKSGMTLDEVLAAEKLTQDDVEIQENESSVDGHIYTLATTKAEYFYAESGELGLSKLYYFRDNGLLQMSYQKHIPSAEFDEGIAKVREFMVKFVENSGAKVVMTGEGFEYHAYGELPTRADEKTSYQVQFIRGGMLTVLDIYTQDLTKREDIGDWLLTVSVGISFDRYGYDGRVNS